VIGKVCPRGQDVAGLIRYLYGPGRREEHTDPHIIAGYRPPSDLEPRLRASGSRDFHRLAGLLRLPHDVLGRWGYAKPVWHCSMRASPEDRLLSDAEWPEMPMSAFRPVCRPPGYAVFAVKVLVKWLFLRSVVGIILAL
jgi:hypothetical protein